MTFQREQLLLYAVTDRAWTGRQTLFEQVEDALKGGVTLVQLREKELPQRGNFWPRPRPFGTSATGIMSP